VVGGFCEDGTCPFSDHVQACPLGGCVCHTRIIAKFIPQHDENTHRMISDVVDNESGEVRFDVTDEILEMGREKALKIKDDRDESDALLTDEVKGEHDGPFRIVVEDAIRAYFERWDTVEKWWDDSTLDERESAGLKNVLRAPRLEVWFDSLTQTEQAAVVGHLQGETLSLPSKA